MADTEKESLINHENISCEDDDVINCNSNCIYKLFPKLLPCIPERYVLATLLCTGLAVAYMLRVNLSIALVEMVNHTVITGKGPDANITYKVSLMNCSNSTVYFGVFIRYIYGSFGILRYFCYYWDLNQSIDS